MEQPTVNGNICKQHSGHEARIAECERQNIKQFEEIDGMKKWLIGTLVSVIIGLIIAGANLIITLAKG